MAASVLLISFGGCKRHGLELSATPPPDTPVRTVLDQPADRIAEIVSITEWRSRNQFDTILAGLNDPDDDVRQAAARQAERLLGKAIPYHSFWPTERRAAAMDAYRRLAALAEENKKSFLIDLVPVLLDRIETGSPAERQQTIDDTVLLTGVTFGMRAADPPDVRLARTAMYRRVWATWNKPGNQVLEQKRHPVNRP